MLRFRLKKTEVNSGNVAVFIREIAEIKVFLSPAARAESEFRYSENLSARCPKLRVRIPLEVRGISKYRRLNSALATRNKNPSKVRIFWNPIVSQNDSA